ncbi:hypothetical protein B0A55_00996 [Friedmanniomyces simplex]|uniref:Major facilitator superfamily (MFS) profile domain-containing protein n=1 Tax=Friedmanniomyces simplex TaxID=329884 RepID=A0A4U0Y5I7_9PEZI|nr:hypothetical protein B0A55_00996 [Friedmanniomyces simplex]
MATPLFIIFLDLNFKQISKMQQLRRVEVCVVVNLVNGVGLGVLYPSLTFAVQAAVTNKDQAYGVSLFIFFRAAGQCIGVAVGGTIFSNSMKREILRHSSIAEFASERSAEASSLVEVMKGMEPRVAKDGLSKSFADALVVVWIGMTALSVVALISSLWKKHYNLERSLETDHGSAAQNVSSIAFAGTVIGQLVFGYTSDHYSRKWSLLVSTVILFVFAALCAGSYGAGGSQQGLFAALTAFRFLLGIGIGGEYPAGSVACAEASGELKEGHRNRWFCLFTNTQIDLGF